LIASPIDSKRFGLTNRFKSIFPSPFNRMDCDFSVTCRLEFQTTEYCFLVSRW